MDINARKEFQIRLGTFIFDEIKKLPESKELSKDTLNLFGDALSAVMATFTFGFREADVALQLEGLRILDQVTQTAFDGVAASLLKNGAKK